MSEEPKREEFRDFSEFYEFYISEHQDSTNRRLHFAGCLLVILIVLYSVITGKLIYLLLAPVAGYGAAWIGHFFFEKNRPATFKYPLYSLMGDWVMFRDILTGKLKL